MAQDALLMDKASGAPSEEGDYKCLMAEMRCAVPHRAKRLV
jgi:hypothetical protein